MSGEENIYDVLIIGGGPAGLSAAQYASRSKLKTLVIDKSRTAGALAYTGHIENYPGVPGPVSGKELLDLFRGQAVTFGAEVVEAQVVGVKLDGEIKEIFTMEGGHKGKSVIIGTGSMGRKASIKGEAEFLGRGVSYWRKKSSRKNWIAHVVKPACNVRLDHGAVKGLVESRKSLLPSGIVSVEGPFKAGDAVYCLDEHGTRIAKGIVNYSTQDVERIRGRQSSEIEDLLGYKYSDEVIHRDNLVVLKKGLAA